MVGEVYPPLAGRSFRIPHSEFRIQPTADDEDEDDDEDDCAPDD